MEDRDPVYFNYYGQLQHQQNMLEDGIRTDCYYQAIMQNKAAFAGKVVLDVGAGTGILSFFAAQAGARRVYAVEASNMAQQAELLVRSNNLETVIMVIRGKIEEVELPEQVDIIVSEPMGVLLLHERMIESFLYARDRFLKRNLDGSTMYPSCGTILLAPFTDATMHADMKSRAKFWRRDDFYGMDLSALAGVAVDQIFAQPVVGGFDPRSLLARPATWATSFAHDPISRLLDISIPLELTMQYTGIVHGLAGWFTVGFAGSVVSLELTTAPDRERTHWQQCRFFFRRPIGVNAGQRLSGTFRMTANGQRSYDIVVIVQVGEVRVEEAFSLHDQQYCNLGPASYPEVAPECLGLYE